jgi:ABC-type phosphate transport system substrate-binding protein
LGIGTRTAPYFIGIALVLGTALLGAEDDVVVVVSRESSVTALTRDQIADLFLGRLSRFPGGVKAAPIDQPEGSPVRNSFYADFAAKSPAQVKAHWSKIIFTGRGQPPEQVPDSKAALERVAEVPGAIAYIERSLANESVRIVSE